MTAATDAATPLPPDEAARLTDFAHACRAAARAVVLYPGSHPAVSATLCRIVQITAPASQSGPLKLQVLPDGLLLDGRAAARPDPAIGELAILLHSHFVGELTVHPGGDVQAWRTFLVLLGRTPESVRAEGGIARLWTTTARRHIELREIDGAPVLKEHEGGLWAEWEQIVAHCLQGAVLDLNDETVRTLVEIVGDPDGLAELVRMIDAQGTANGTSTTAKAAAVLRMLRGLADAVTKVDPTGLERALQLIATAVGQLSADMMVELLSPASHVGDETEDTQLISSVLSRMSDRTIVRFVARNVQAESTPTDRLAQAFQTLVRDGEERQRLLALAYDEAAGSPLGQTDGFQKVWSDIARRLLTSYSDRPIGSDAYGRELSGARAQAIQIEQVSGDPPERVAAWLQTVAATALRVLDLALLVDLLRIEEDPERWRGLMRPAIGLIEDLLLVGDFDAAAQLIEVLVGAAGPQGPDAKRQTATLAIGSLVAGRMMPHIVTHLATVNDTQFERVKAMCVSMGKVIVSPLADSLSVEERALTRERLTSILVAFGASGRPVVERLKGSSNAAVRRTAVYLLREFGGSDALPDLTELLNDSEPQVQREAVRAILKIGTDRAYQVLERAMTTGSATSQDAIMQSIGLVRDERAAPLFTYILRNIDHRGPLGSIYLRAIEWLGALRDPEGIAPLKEALHRGEWWAPRRTATLRAAAAAALACIGTPAALAVLDEAATIGTRGVRSVARQLASKARVRMEAHG